MKAAVCFERSGIPGGAARGRARTATVARALAAGVALMASVASPATAQRMIGIGGSVTGTLGAADTALSSARSHSQLFSFYGAAGRTVQIDLLSGDFDPRLSLEDWEGQTIAAGDESAGTGSARISYNLPYTGIYQILAGARRVDQLGTFTLSVRETQAHVLPPDVDAPKLVTVGTIGVNQETVNVLAASAPTYDNRKYDAYAFACLAGQPFQMDILSDWDNYAMVIDPGGNVVSRDGNSGGGTNARLVHTCAASGEYHLLVTTASPNGSVGRYTLRVQAYGAAAAVLARIEPVAPPRPVAQPEPAPQPQAAAPPAPLAQPQPVAPAPVAQPAPATQPQPVAPAPVAQRAPAAPPPTAPAPQAAQASPVAPSPQAAQPLPVTPVPQAAQPAPTAPPPAAPTAPVTQPEPAAQPQAVAQPAPVTQPQPVAPAPVAQRAPGAPPPAAPAPQAAQQQPVTPSPQAAQSLPLTPMPQAAQPAPTAPSPVTPAGSTAPVTQPQPVAPAPVAQRAPGAPPPAAPAPQAAQQQPVTPSPQAAQSLPLTPMPQAAQPAPTAPSPVTPAGSTAPVTQPQPVAPAPVAQRAPGAPPPAAPAPQAAQASPVTPSPQAAQALPVTPVPQAAQPAPTAPPPAAPAAPVTQPQPVAPAQVAQRAPAAPVTQPPVATPPPAPAEAPAAGAIPGPGVIGQIAIGSSMQGRLEPGDQIMGDSFADTWQFQGAGGETVTLDVESSAFSPYLRLYDADGNRLGDGTASGGGAGSRLVFVLPATGMYQIVIINGEGRRETGAYTISIR